MQWLPGRLVRGIQSQDRGPGGFNKMGNTAISSHGNSSRGLGLTHGEGKAMATSEVLE